jgi:AcrR family transcriptional regulator
MDAREQLLQAAIRVYGAAGTRGATTRRIAREAGVNEVTLFRQFGSKEALLRGAIQSIYDRDVLRPLPDEPADPWRELTDWCRVHHEFLIRIRSMLRTSMAEFPEHPEHMTEACKLPLRVASELRDYLLRLRARGLARGRWSARAATALLMAAIFEDAMQRDIMPARFPSPAREAVRQYVALVLTAIGVERPGRARRRARAGQ